jgi:hypothetical protein
MYSIRNNEELSSTHGLTIHKPTSEQDIIDIAKACIHEFKLQPYQFFVKHFLSDTPYNNSLLLFHGLGTGNTCSIGIAEQYRRIGHKPMYVLGNISNFKLELFNESNLSFDSHWTYSGCTNFLDEFDSSGMTKDQVVTQVHSIIHKYYTFLEYHHFAKRIDSMKQKAIHICSKLPNANHLLLFKQMIHNEFEHSLFIIDQFHDIRPRETLMDIVQNTSIKLLLLSNTPMFNSADEIMFILQLFYANDKRTLPSFVNQLFHKGDFNIDLKDSFRNLIQGYISVANGDTPYSFPFRLYETSHYSYPIPLHTNLFILPFTPIQQSEYVKLLGNNLAIGQLNKVQRCLMMGIDCIQSNPPHKPSLYSYSTTEPCYQQLQTYSLKLFNLIHRFILPSHGIVLVYSKFITKGLHHIAMALESVGIMPKVGKPMLPPQCKPHSWSYVIIDKSNADELIARINDISNIHGDDIKVVLISQASQSFKHIRQIHICDPCFNFNRIEQIIGRGVHMCSHAALDFKERNVQIILYASIYHTRNDTNEAIDHFYYRYAEEQAIKMGIVSKIINEAAVDCHLYGTHYDIANIDVSITNSLGKSISYNVNAKAFSHAFIDCSIPKKKLKHADIVSLILQLFTRHYLLTFDDIRTLLPTCNAMAIYATLSDIIEHKITCKDALQRDSVIVNYGKRYLCLPLQNHPVTLFKRRIHMNPFVTNVE